MDQMRPELDNAIQCLSLHGYSIFSLVDDILACRNSNDERINLLREGMERDSADICARLLCFHSAPKRVLKCGKVQCMCFTSSAGRNVGGLSCVHSQYSQTCSSN